MAASSDSATLNEALIDACLEGNAEDCEHALASGADLQFRSPRRGVTAFHVAAQGGHRALAERLLELGSDLHTRDEHGCTPLFDFVRGDNDLEHAAWLLDLGIPVDDANGDGWTPLMIACTWNDRWDPLIALLLRRGANANHIGRDDWTPLLLSCESRPRAFASAALLDSPALNVNLATPHYGWTPLLYAAASSNLDAVAHLLKRGADIHARMKIAPGKPYIAKATPSAKSWTTIRAKPEHDGFTALHWAVLKKRRCRKLLVEAGADVDARSRDGRTPRDLGAPPQAPARPQRGSNEAELLAAIAANPDDDAPRSVYSDWLLEQGNPWGEVIALALKIATLPPGAPERPKLTKQLEKLEKQHAAAFLGPLTKTVRRWRFERGLVSLAVADAQLFPGAAEAIAERAPRATVQLTGLKPKGVDALLSAPLGRFATVILGENRIDDEIIARLAAAPTLAGVETLRLTGNVFTDRGAQALAQSAHLESLKELEAIDISPEQRLTATALQAIGSSRKLPRLRSLSLSCSGAWRDALAECVIPLDELCLYQVTHFDDDDARALAALKTLSRLERLTIQAPVMSAPLAITDAGVDALRRSRHFKLEKIEIKGARRLSPTAG